MAISKTAAYQQALSEIARCQDNENKRYTIKLYDNSKSSWIDLGNIGATAAREFERRYIEHRISQLLNIQ